MNIFYLKSWVNNLLNKLIKIQIKPCNCFTIHDRVDVNANKFNSNSTLISSHLSFDYDLIAYLCNAIDV